ncbi:MAG: 2-phospho-L-lactate guanylyltransferase [Oceanospirillaceae bacterium]|nr:2-phospho-L-lactate guanylyltransferase [Oceanospirillaceae bacterium]MBT13003.1 2-phospho-L-lactate guanylyltransferase [Oceanospirillaceae bacterium]|tara:strand:- start:9249 stop:9944 length:696 start_codon:yes stop_codon:yes gene_type:complete
MNSQTAHLLADTCVADTCVADTCVVVPMKNPLQSKQRLRPLLSNHQRSDLAIHLYRNTLAFFKREFPALTLLVVTPSAQIAQMANEHGHQVLLEQKSRGLNRALERAAQWTVLQGFRRQLVIPADIAELDADEIRNMLGRVSHGHGVAIARAKDGGTNALLCAPANAIPFCFGHNSAHRHTQLSQLSNIHCEVVDLKKLAADIDVPDDLNTSLFADMAFANKEPEGALQYA